MDKRQWCVVLTNANYTLGVGANGYLSVTVNINPFMDVFFNSKSTSTLLCPGMMIGEQLSDCGNIGTKERTSK